MVLVALGLGFFTALALVVLGLAAALALDLAAALGEAEPAAATVAGAADTLPDPGVGSVVQDQPPSNLAQAAPVVALP